MQDRGTLVVTGATGFIGAALCRHFVQSSYQVIALEGLTRAPWRLKGVPVYDTVKIDLCDMSAVSAFLAKVRPSIVLNCAAYGAYPSQIDFHQIHRVNFEGLRNILQSLQGKDYVKAVIHAGSSSEYGDRCSGPDEMLAPLPDSHYAVSTVAATALVQYYGRKLAVPAWSLRIYSVYGPYEESSRLIPRLLTAIDNGLWPPLVDRHISRDFIHTYDIASAFEALIDQADKLPRGEVFNVGTGKRTTLEELVNLCAQLFSIKAEPQWGSMTNRGWDHPDWFANIDKITKMTRWQPRITLAEGLKSTMNWLKTANEAKDDAHNHSILKGA